MLRNGTKDGIQGANAQAPMVRDRDPLVKKAQPSQELRGCQSGVL